MYIYSQTTGVLIRFGAITCIMGHGYAGGNCGKNPEGKNNPAMQTVPCVGPLPQGMYTIEPPVEHTRLGPCALPLMPDASNKMFGRSGFFMHADEIVHPGSASEGCIVMSQSIRESIAINLSLENRLMVSE